MFNRYRRKEALEIVDREGQNISLIISDQRMPKMTGTEFLSHVAEKHPIL